MGDRTPTTNAQHVGDSAERLVPIVAVKSVGCRRSSEIRSRHKQVYKGVVVKITKESLDPEIVYSPEASARTDISELSGSIILQQLGCARSVIENKAIHVPVVINISEIRTP